MDPEASVSALVFHHPDCAYFSVGDSQDASNDESYPSYFVTTSEYGANL